jgi:kinesin family protein C2/C3
MIGPLSLPRQPSEEELRLCLRNGLVLCNVINKVHPGAVPKVVENPISSHDGAQFAYQHFENVRNFLVAVEDMGLPAFEASDLEQVQCCRTSKVLKGCWEIFPFSGNPFAIKGCSRGEVR